MLTATQRLLPATSKFQSIMEKEGRSYGTAAWKPLELDPRKYKLTDQGLAERLCERYKDRMLFCPEFGWMKFNGKQWCKDADHLVYMDAVETVLSIQDDIDVCQDVKLIKKLRAHKHGSQANAKIKSMMESASKRVRVHHDIFDRHPWLFNVKNGIVDLRTGELSKHNPALYLTQFCGTDYRPEAKCPKFLEALSLMFSGDADMLKYIQRLCGYFLSGDTAERIVLIFFGPTGANGKSFFISILQNVMGDDYAGTVEPAALSDGKRDFHLVWADLCAKRFVSTVETADGCNLNIALLKQLSGGTDKISARHHYKEPFAYVPQYKIVIGTNWRPQVPNGGDQSAWERLKEIPFDTHIPPEKRIKNYSEVILSEEKEGVLAWMLEGAKRYWQDGRTLAEPDTVKRATNAYMVDQQIAETFVQTCLDTSDPSGFVDNNTLDTEWNEFLKGTARYAKKETLASHLTKKGYEMTKERGIRGRRGIRLKAA